MLRQKKEKSENMKIKINPIHGKHTSKDGASREINWEGAEVEFNLGELTEMDTATIKLLNPIKQLVMDIMDKRAEIAAAFRKDMLAKRQQIIAEGNEIESEHIDTCHADFNYHRADDGDLEYDEESMEFKPTSKKSKKPTSK